MNLRQDKTIWLPNSEKPQTMFLCLWERPDGAFIVNENGEFLCAESLRENDKKVEYDMRKAAENLGFIGGKPFWREGRKISQMEWEDQMERLMEGKIPDERDAAIAQMEDEYLDGT